LDVAVSDQAGGEAKEGFVDVVASFPADPQAAEAVQPGDRPLDHPTEDAQARAVFLASFGDHRGDASRPDKAPVLALGTGGLAYSTVASSPRSSTSW
jgi:hypothetical protein